MTDDAHAKTPVVNPVKLALTACAIGRHCPADFEERIGEGPGSARMPYRLYVPRTGRRRADGGDALPLVLYLHGSSGRGTNNVSHLALHNALVPGLWVMPQVQKGHPCFVLAPQCPSSDKWVRVSWKATSHTQPESPCESLLRAVAVLEEVEQAYVIDPDRVYLVGQSMGAYGAWDLIARMPSRFAAAVIVSGGADEQTAPLIAHVPIWTFHGDADETVPVCRSRNMVNALREAGGSPRYTEYAGRDHFIYPYVVMEQGLARWLFSQRRRSGNDE